MSTTKLTCESSSATLWGLQNGRWWRINLCKQNHMLTEP